MVFPDMDDDEPECAVPTKFTVPSAVKGGVPSAARSEAVEFNVKPECITEIIDAVCHELAREAARVQIDIATFASMCHERYGRGAFVAFFASLEDVRNRNSITVNDCVNLIESGMRSRPATPQEIPGPTEQTPGLDDLDPSLAFLFQCPKGRLGRRIVYMKAEQLKEQLPNGPANGFQVLDTYLPETQICCVGGLNAGENKCYCAVASCVESVVVADLQDVQFKRWVGFREEIGLAEKTGDELLEKGNVGIKSALAMYREALKIHVDSALEETAWEVQMRLRIATLLARTDQWDESVQMCNSALNLDPQNAKVLFRRGNAFHKLGRLDESRADLDRAAQLMLQDRKIREGLDPAILETPELTSPPIQRTFNWFHRSAGIARRCAVEMGPLMWGKLALFGAGVVFVIATFPEEAFTYLIAYMKGDTSILEDEKRFSAANVVMDEL